MVKYLDLDGLKYYHQALCNKFNLTPYSKKTETVKDIEVYNPIFDNDDDDTPSNTSIRIELADGTHKYVNVPEASEPHKVGTFTYPGNAGFMSVSDKTKLNSIPSKYIPTSDGVINEDMTFSKALFVKDLYIEGYIAGGNQDEGVIFANCGGIVHFNQDEAIKSKLWNAQGGTIDVSEILINAAIYVEGEITRAAGSVNYNDVINYPNSIVFDTVTGIFYAKKDDKLYTHWNAYLQKNIYPPEKYGAVVDNYVYPLPKQMYRFGGDNDIYICSYLNNVATMTIFTIN